MDSPKVSVLIPTYNRRHYIEQCLDSALNQNFQDYEIIIRDNASTDGAADFIMQKYAAEISSGKIKLHRNKKNYGGTANGNMLVHDARGKYIMFLHDDDMYLSHALQHMYEVAEFFQADVVHECKYLTTYSDGIIGEDKPLALVNYDANQVNEIEIMPSDLYYRVNEWFSMGIDIQHNIFNRKFFIDNELIFYPFFDARFLALKWLLRAKTFVKTPVPFYIYRQSHDSDTNSKFTPERVAQFISNQIKTFRYLDEFFATEDFLKNNKDLQYRIRNHMFYILDNFWIIRNGIYKNGVTPELNQAVEDTFKKYFGDDYALPVSLFHWLHSGICRQDHRVINSSSKNFWE